MTNKLKKNAGFTLIEIIVVVSLLALLTAVGVQTLGGKKESGRFGTAKLELTKNFPEAISSMLQVRADCGSTTKAMLTARGLESNNVLKQSWSVSASAANSVTVTYPMETATQATDMAGLIGSSSFVNSATATGVNISVQYSCL